MYLCYNEGQGLLLNFVWENVEHVAPKKQNKLLWGEKL